MAGEDLVQSLRQLVKDFAGGPERVSTFYLLNVAVFSTLDARLADRILRFSSLRKNNRLTRYHFTKLFGELSVIMLNGREWKLNRDIYRTDSSDHRHIWESAWWRTETLRSGRQNARAPDRSGGL